jgi:hypothetical protein
MPNVNCTVDNCQYWTNGNFCKAQQIIIQNDLEGGISPDSKLETLKSTPAGTVDDTCCQTFKLK